MSQESWRGAFGDWIGKIFRRRRPQPTPTPVPPPIVNQPVVNALLAGLNAFRQQNSLGPVELNPMLMAAAQKHSNWMAANKVIDHTGQGGSRPAQRIAAEGYSWSAAAENIAEGYATPDAVTTGWINSPGHRANMLGSYHDVGFGSAKADNGAIYWTTDFGTSLPSSSSVLPMRRMPVIESGPLRANNRGV